MLQFLHTVSLKVMVIKQQASFVPWRNKKARFQTQNCPASRSDSKKEVNCIMHANPTHNATI